MDCPRSDELVEMLFTDLLEAPEGWEYHLHDGRALYPVYGQDKWRLLLRKGTDVVPVFIDGQFILKLTKALHAMQRELNTAVGDELGEPCQNSSKEA
jgi:hypothetical protein